MRELMVLTVVLCLFVPCGEGLQASLRAGQGAASVAALLAGATPEVTAMTRLAAFRVDVTPPIGHPLCAGWYGTAIGVSDRLYAQGVVLLGHDGAVVLCAMDFAEISNRSHISLRQKLAAAAGTTADRVAVQSLHAHCTPWPDEEAQQLVSGQSGVVQVMDPAWIAQTFDRMAAAVKAAVPQAEPVTHIGFGQAKVQQVASSRRILGPDGRIKAVRWTKTTDPAVRAEPEGLIDPWLKTISFWNEDRKLAALHYYAVHDTSYDRDRMVTPDFLGLARDQRMAEDGDVPHVFFNGCAGNITAGKYNDGAEANRAVLTERVYRALVESERQIEREEVRGFRWKTRLVHLPPREDMDETALLAELRDPARGSSDRSRAALKIAYLRRAQEPIPFTSLQFGDRVCVLHLPGESFIEYQLFAQAQRPEAFVAVASYGDCGPGYICMERSHVEGGYEPTDSLCSPKCETIMKEAIAALLRP